MMHSKSLPRLAGVLSFYHCLQIIMAVVATAHHFANFAVTQIILCA